MSYGIGLDCGITSVGYSVVKLDSNEEPCKIIKLGARIFPVAENPKNGSSLALPRREARSARRRLRRHRHRIERIRKLITDEKILSEEQLDSLYNGVQADIYELRTKALDEPLTNEEISKVLIHLAQRRGFKSNRKNDKSTDEGKLLAAVNENQALMSSKGYRTVGEMMFKDEKFSEFKRNKGESYSNTVSRSDIEDEIHKIFTSQREFGKKFAEKNIEDRYCDIALSQRSFDEGPGEGSKYGGNQIEKMIGKCTLIADEPRAVKAAYSFQLFTLLQNINHIKIISSDSERFLQADERKAIVSLALKTEKLTYSNIRKELRLSDNECFSGVVYDKETRDKAEKEKKFQYMNAYHEIRKGLDKVKKGRIRELSADELNNIGYALTVYKTDEKIEAFLKEKGLSKTDISAILKVSQTHGFSKVGHISVKACNMIIPYLEQGMTYDKACAAAGLNFKAHQVTQKSKYLAGYAPEITEIKNAVVRRSLSQTIKVINAIIREMDESPVYINIELAREMHKSYDERQKIKKQNDENRRNNEKAKEEITKLFGKTDVKGMDIIKYRLWVEQNNICPYSLKPIDINRLFEDGYVDVDHIVPYSISFDDSYANKVLVLSSENRQKGNKLPLQYLKGKVKEDFIVFVNNNFKGRKKFNLLKENIEDAEDFKQRNLQDTQYLSRVLYNYINDHLEFAPSDKRIKRVNTVNGKITSYMRKRWGIPKIREDGDLHHAVDATVIACVTNGMIQKITKYSNYREIEYLDTDSGSVVLDRNNNIIGQFPYPWPEFRAELEMRTSDKPQLYFEKYRFDNYSSQEIQSIKACFVSRMPNRKTKGAAHGATARSAKEIENGYVISKIDLTSLKLNKDGEIDRYYMPSSDKRLYNALKDQLNKFNGDGKNAFAEFGKDNPFHKPTKDGSLGPVVRKVKVIDKTSLAVPIQQNTAIATNDTMVRIDVYHIANDGYYFVPIYVADTIKSELPNKACTSGKWKEMSDDDFLFSLYQNDLIRIKSKKDIKFTVTNLGSTLPKEKFFNDCLVYYNGADISTASIVCLNHDGSYKIRGLGFKTLLSVEKYETDVLGNIHKVGKEKRHLFRKG